MTVSSTAGSPSLRRRVMTVMRTVLVNGSACSSHTCWRSVSAETAAPSADMQGLEHAELLRRQVELGARARDAAPGGVELEVAAAQDRRARAAGAPRQRADAGHELFPLEGLGEVVVGAEREAVDDVVEAVGGREHEDLGLALVAGEPAADLVAVELGQVAVEDHHVVGEHACLHQRRCAVVGDVDGHALAAQSAGDGAGQPALVFGDKDSHLIPG